MLERLFFLEQMVGFVADHCVTMSYESSLNRPASRSGNKQSIWGINACSVSVTKTVRPSVAEVKDILHAQTKKG